MLAQEGEVMAQQQEPWTQARYDALRSAAPLGRGAGLDASGMYPATSLQLERAASAQKRAAKEVGALDQSAGCAMQPCSTV